MCVIFVVMVTMMLAINFLLVYTVLIHLVRTVFWIDREDLLSALVAISEVEMSVGGEVSSRKVSMIVVMPW